MKWFAKVTQLVLQIPLYSNKVRYFLTEMQSKAERRGSVGEDSCGPLRFCSSPPGDKDGWGVGISKLLPLRNLTMCFPVRYVFPSSLGSKMGFFVPKPGLYL